MKSFLRFILTLQERQRLLLVVSLASFVAFFTYLALNTEIQAFPEFTNVQVQVITQYPGKAAEEVERQVTLPVETSTNGLPGLVSQRSVSIFGLSVVTLTFSDSTQGRQARLDVNQRLGDIELPEGVRPTLNPDSTPVGEIFRYTIEGNVPSDEDRLYEDWVIERELKGIPGVADVVTFGGPVRSVDVIIDLARAKMYGIGIDDVSDAISKNHSNAGGSQIIHGEESYVVRSLGLYRDPYDLEQAVITSRKGVPIRVRDIGNVRIGNKVRNGQVGRNDSDDVVQGIVLLRQGADTLSTCEKVREKVKYLNDTILPDGMKVMPFYDRTSLIEKSGHTVSHNVIFGVGLVCLLLLYGLGLQYWSLVLSVAIIIPFALIIALVGVGLFGLNPNLISLGAVDFGIIVETAIFGAEALILALGHAKEAKNKIVESSLAEVLSPAFLCAFLLVIAFIPILTLQQVEGRIFRPLGITLVCALLGGQLGALLFLPFFAQFAPTGPPPERPLDRWIAALSVRLISLGHRWKRVPNFSKIVAASLFATIGILYFSLGSEFLPNLNEGAIYARATCPKTQSLDAAVEVAARIRAQLKTIPEVKDIISQIGRPDDGTDINGFDNIEIFITLLPMEKWKSAKTLDGLIEVCKDKVKEFAGIDFGFSQPIKDNVDEAISGVKGELVLKVFGRQLPELQKIATQLRDVVSKIPGAVEVSMEELLGQPELRFDLQRDLLSRYGLSVSQVQGMLESALLGKKAGRLLDSNNRFVDILVKPVLPAKPDQISLEALPVLTPAGNAIPLGEVTTVQLSEGISRIYREQGERRIALRAGVRGRAVVEVVKEANQKIAASVKLPEGYHMEWAGSFENAQRASQRLAIIVPICFFFIVVLLFSWFKSWPVVLLALWQIPFSLPGGLLALRLCGLNLSISAAAGGIVLLGVSLLTGIMLLTHREHLDSGELAVKEGLKGVLLSSGVAIVGLIPAAFSSAIGSETARPFAVMILGGLISSLFFTLTVFPTLLMRNDRKKETAGITPEGR